MKKFIGTKTIYAKPMTRAEYNDYRGWALPADEDGNDEGYLVEYVGGGKPNMPEKHKGYVSWSPNDVFEAAYQAQPDIAERSCNDLATERMIEAGGLTARRGSLDELHGSIKNVEIIRHVVQAGNVLRFAILTLENGFTVTGRPSVAVSPENDDEDTGIKIAIENAVHELWPFLGFKIVQQKHEAKT